MAKMIPVHPKMWEQMKSEIFRLQRELEGIKNDCATFWIFDEVPGAADPREFIYGLQGRVETALNAPSVVPRQTRLLAALQKARHGLVHARSCTGSYVGHGPDLDRAVNALRLTLKEYIDAVDAAIEEREEG